jgi:hypothetical protein
VQDVLGGPETTLEIARSPRAHVIRLCGGGQLAVAAAGRLAVTGGHYRMATVTVGIANVDFSQGSAGLALLDRAVADNAIRRSQRTGCFDWRAIIGHSRGGHFARSLGARLVGGSEACVGEFARLARAHAQVPQPRCGRCRWSGDVVAVSEAWSAEYGPVVAARVMIGRRAGRRRSAGRAKPT